MACLRARGAAAAPEAVQIELLPQLHAQPACAPLARPFEPHFAQPHAQRIDIVRRHRARRKQGHLAAGPLVIQLDRLAPRLALTGVNLAQVQHLTLHHMAIAQTAVLHHVPVLVALAILHASSAAQKHAPTLRTVSNLGNDQSLHYKRFTSAALYQSITCARKSARFP